MAPDATDPARTCPECGEPRSNVLIVGPTVAIVQPCGHRVPPQRLDDG